MSRWPNVKPRNRQGSSVTERWTSAKPSLQFFLRLSPPPPERVPSPLVRVEPPQTASSSRWEAATALTMAALKVKKEDEEEYSYSYTEMAQSRTTTPKSRAQCGHEKFIDHSAAEI